MLPVTSACDEGLWYRGYSPPATQAFLQCTIYDPCNPSKNPGWKPGSESLVIYQTVVTGKISSSGGGGGASLSKQYIAELMFCHGTQTNSGVCHCLLFHKRGKQNFM